jgi:hypothetical protein
MTDYFSNKNLTYLFINSHFRNHFFSPNSKNMYFNTFFMSLPVSIKLEIFIIYIFGCAFFSLHFIIRIDFWYLFESL